MLGKRYGVPKPTLRKVGVDGTEGSILAGAESVLKSSTLRSILVEVNVGNGLIERAETDRWLRGFSYKLVRKSDGIYEWDGIRSQNFIFHR